jgi:hypothetical protein
VATWKDIPQDARGLVAWKEAIGRLRSRRDVRQIAGEFGASYIVIDRRRSVPPAGWRRVYPLFHEENATFAVYRAPEPLP